MFPGRGTDPRIQNVHPVGWALMIGALAASATTSGCGASSPPDFASRRGTEQHNVLLITLDTIRADHIGAYGNTEASTPVIDGLAAEGVRFEAAYGPVPLTLPSHTSLMTGTYPMFHGVRDNGGFVVPPEVETLAERFSAHGYSSAAFVSAYVLDSRWGLDQGFGVYFDEFDVAGERIVAMGSVQRPADEVVDAAIDWLSTVTDGPFFLWVHLYDPHAPYDPPEPYRSRFAGRPYLGEIAFTDAQVGRLLDHLDAVGKRDRTFIVLTGDHGESLGEHGETQHGLFIYEGAIRVPLVFWVPFDGYRGVVRSEPTSLVDIAPTLHEMVGLEPTDQHQGVSLVQRFDPTTDVQERAIYAESLYGRLHYGWSELAALIGPRHKLIESSEPELFDLAADPREQRNLVGVRNTDFRRLSLALDSRRDGWSANALAAGLEEVDDETRQRLAALGYVGTFSEVDHDPGEPLPSPRSRIDLYNKTIDARQAMSAGEPARAETLLLEILEVDPDILDVHQSLGELYFDQGRFAEAAGAYRSAIALKPDYTYGYVFLFDALMAEGELQQAEQVLEDSLEFVEPTPQIWLLLGDVRRVRGDMGSAREAYASCLELNPDSAPALAGLAQLEWQEGDLGAAARYARQALERNDRIPHAHFVLAEHAESRGDGRLAATEYEKEIEVNPENVAAHFNLAMLHRVAGRAAAERQGLETVLELDPDHALGNLFMARLLVGANERLEEATRRVERALEQEVEQRERVLAYYLLADLANRRGDPTAAARWLRQAEQLRATLEPSR